jgi:hypothetical protein
MTSTEALILALILLTGDGPATPQDPSLLHKNLPAVRQAVVGLALDWEILDSREAPGMLTSPESAGRDLEMLRRRYRDLRDAPSAADAYRFPGRAMINEYLAFNRAYKTFVESREPMEVGDRTDIRGAAQEADELYDIWNTLKEARTEYYYITVRRAALKRLRDLLGEDAYQGAILPPHVPIWRFQEVD